MMVVSLLVFLDYEVFYFIFIFFRFSLVSGMKALSRSTEGGAAAPLVSSVVCFGRASVLTILEVQICAFSSSSARHAPPNLVRRRSLV